MVMEYLEDGYLRKSRKASPDDAASVHLGSENIGTCGKVIHRNVSPHGIRVITRRPFRTGERPTVCVSSSECESRGRGGLLPAAAECAVLRWDGISGIVRHLQP
jgi:hypothetical protein